MPLLIRGATVVTVPQGSGPRRGPAMNSLATLQAADVLCEGERIAAVGPSLPAPAGSTIIHASGRLLTPGLIDCHTHACWAGSRLDEWERKLRGEDYLSILKAGGGIMSTVRAVRAASQEDLTASLLTRLNRMLASGTTTAEVKSGYGLSTQAELKMLRAIAAARPKWPGTLVATALLGHAIDPDEPSFVDRVINETLPAVSAEFPGITIDAFCEKGAWSLDQTVRLFEKALALGHPIRVHADQFNALGMTRDAIRLGARSVDHLEATTEADARALAASDAIAVALPLCVAHLGSGPAANLRRIIDHGGAAAIATNWNPGSAPSGSLPLAMAFAVRSCGLTPAEALTACTANAAAVLQLEGRGRIQPESRADLVLWNTTDPRELAFEFGGPGVHSVIASGAIVSRPSN
jgi:imidazolonepropionase